MLRCNAKGVKNGYPLKIEAEKVENIEAEFNADFVTRMLPKLEWSALVKAAKELGAGTLPSELNESMVNDEAFLKTVHHILLEVRLIEGTLVCPESGRKFPVKNSIPNMLLNEDEV